MKEDNTISVQCIFSFWLRLENISDYQRNMFHKGIADNLNENGHYPLAVNSDDYHVQFLFSHRGAKVFRSVRRLKSEIIRKAHRQGFRFLQWERGYSLFYHGKEENNKIVSAIQEMNFSHRTLAI